MIATLRKRDFLLAWLGGLISLIGDWILLIALPLHIYDLTGSTLATSGMFIAEIIPSLLLASIAGVFVDRWDRKRTMLITNLVLAASVLPILAVRSSEWVWVAYIATFVKSSAGMFFRPAENALLPRLVDEQHLLAANSLNALNNNLARLIGPAVGGSIMGLFGITAVVAANSVAFLVAAMLVAGIVASGRPERTEDDGVDAAGRAWRRVHREWVDGLAVVRRSRAVSTLLGLDAIAALGEGVFGVMFVVWVAEILGGDSRELGWLMSAQAVGGLTGGVLLGSAASRFAPPKLFGVGSLAFGILDLALFNYPLVISGIWPGILLISMVGVPSVGIGAGFMTMVQQSVQDAYRGRVFGLMGTTSSLLRLAGTLIAGVLGGIAGPLLLLNIQGGSYMLMGLLALIVLPRLLAAQGHGHEQPTSTPVSVAERP